MPPLRTMFAWIDTKGRYEPRLTSRHEYAESAEEYCQRMGSLLPAFPGSVLTQWFYDHWAQIDGYAWLRFETLGFERMLWSVDDALSSGIKDNRVVRTDQCHFETGVTTTRIQRIAAYFKAHGTWPVPPVFLANKEGTIVRPDGFRLTSPYHVLEGHHRAALFCAFAGRGAVTAEHEVWVATVADA